MEGEGKLTFYLAYKKRESHLACAGVLWRKRSIGGRYEQDIVRIEAAMHIVGSRIS